VSCVINPRNRLLFLNGVADTQIMSDIKLKYEHELFCQRYIVDFNGSKAYKSVYPNVTDESARACASELLTNVNVKRRIDQLMESRIAAVRITADRVLHEFERLAMVDPLEAYTPEGQLKPMHEIPEDLRRAISSIEVDELFEGRGSDRTQVGYTKKLKFWPKEKALEALGKYLKMFVDRLEHSGSLTLEDAIVGVRKKESQGKGDSGAE